MARRFGADRPFYPCRVLRGLSALAALACLAAAPQAPPPAVTVVAARRGTITERVVVTGSFVAREEVLVTPQVDGHAITEIDAEAGDTVASGQVLARLSSATLEAQMAQDVAQVARAAAAIDQAQGTIAENEANRVEAEAAFARAKALLSTGSASRENYEQRLAAAQTAAARLAASQNALRMARAELTVAEAEQRERQVDLDRTQIRAPVAGLVSRRTARLGAVVSQSGEALFRIVAGGAVELEGLVPEGDLARLRPGQPASLTTPGQDAPMAGQVRLVSPEVDSATRLGQVRIALAPGLRPALGAFGRASIEVARHDGVLLPLAAVQFETDGARVDVVQAGVVHSRRVTLGLQSAGAAEIAAGLAPGEQVVAIAGSFVRDGDRVVAVPEG